MDTQTTDIDLMKAEWERNGIDCIAEMNAIVDHLKSALAGYEKLCVGGTVIDTLKSEIEQAEAFIEVLTHGHP